MIHHRQPSIAISARNGPNTEITPDQSMINIDSASDFQSDRGGTVPVTRFCMYSLTPELYS
jgi:hypothetical protein